MRHKHALALDAIHVEQELLQEVVGAQDQISAAHGGFNCISFNVDDTIEVKRVVTFQGRQKELEQHLALYFTGFSRIASEIAREQIRVTPQKKKELDTIFQMVNEAEAIVSSPSRPIDEFGKLLHDNWRVKRTLTRNITNKSIDDIYEAGLSAGALGGKLLGAGGGGFMLFFVPPENREALRLRLKKLLCVPFAFSKSGSQVVVYEPEGEYDEGLMRERREVYAQNEHP